MERVSKGAGSPGFVAFAAPLDAAFTSPFDKLRTQFQPTRDAELDSYTVVYYFSMIVIFSMTSPMAMDWTTSIPSIT